MHTSYLRKPDETSESRGIKFLKKQPVTWSSGAWIASERNTPDLKAVLFDFDNVLMDKKKLSRIAYEQMFEEMAERGYPLPEGVSYDDKMKNEDSKAFTLRIYRDKKIANEALALVKEISASQEYPEIAGAKRTLDLLHSLNVPIAIVSNSHEDELAERFSSMFGPKYRDIPVLAEAKKPSPARIHEALEMLGVSAGDDVLYIGDRIDNDVEAAIAAGCHPVIFGNSEINSPDLARVGDKDNPIHIGYTETHADLQQLIQRYASVSAARASAARGR